MDDKNTAIAYTEVDAILNMMDYFFTNEEWMKEWEKLNK